MNFRTGISVLCIAALLLSGCAQKSITIDYKEYYPACAEPVNALNRADDNAATAAVVGGLVGGAIGVALGVIVSGKASGGIVGGILGILTAATITYAGAKQKAVTDARARYASYNGDMDGEIANLDQRTMAGREAQSCYEKVFFALVSQYKAKEVSRDEYEARYREIYAGLQTTAKLLQDASDASRKVEEQFQAALNEESRLAGQSVAAPSPQAVKERRGKAAQRARQTAASAEQPLPLPGERNLPDVAVGSGAYSEARQDAEAQKNAADAQLLKMKALNDELHKTL